MIDVPRHNGSVGTVPPPTARRRVSAGLALFALATAAVVVLISILRAPLQSVTALVLVVVATLSAWAALVQRGVMRIAGTVVLVAAFASLVLLLVDVQSLTRAAVLAVLVALSAATTRAAVGRDLIDAPHDAHRVPAAEHGVLLMNPRSGGGAVQRCGLVAEAQRRGVTPVIMQPGEDLRELAEHADATGADVIGMAGGDGSQALVAEVAHRHDAAMVCVPAGTRKHFALDLGLDRADVAGALDAFGEAFERRIDLAAIGDRIFVNNASLGVYATVVQSHDYRDAKVATAARLLPELLGPRSAGFELRFEEPDGALQEAADLVLVSNNAYRLDGSPGSGTRPRLDAGVLGVITVTIERAADLLRVVAGDLTGIPTRSLRRWTAPAFDVDSGEPLLAVGVDGEALQLAPPLHFRTMPGALRVRIPLGAPAASPAALRPNGPGAAVRAVLRVLRGMPAR